MITKASNHRCILIIIADGFDELETIIWLSKLRQAGLSVKSVGLTNGLVGGIHGIWLMPDLTFADLDHLLKTTAINLVVLPGGGQSLGRLEADPRVHKLLRQVIAQQGQIVTTTEGLLISQIAAVWPNVSGDAKNNQAEPILLCDSATSPDVFVQGLIQQLLQSPRV